MAAVEKSPSAYPGPFRRAFLLPRYWPTWVALGLLWLLTQLPGGLRRALGRCLGDLIYARNAKRRRFVHLNLAWCFPARSEAEREALARGYFRTMAQSLLDYGLLWWGSERRLDHTLRLEGAEHLERARAEGRAVILLTSHNVALDFGAAALTRHFPSVGLIKEARNPLLEWMSARGRTRFKGTLYRREEGMRPVVRAVRHGHAFYYLPDEDLGPERSVFVPFFGVPTATITALSKLARMTHAAVLPYTTIYHPEQGRYVAHVYPPLPDFPGDDETRDAVRMRQELEKLILLAPEQYMWSLRLFQTRPDGEPNPYG